MAGVPGEDTLRASTATRFEEFGALREEWNGLVRAMPRPSPFLIHEWLETWARHHVPDGTLRVQLVRDGGRLVGAVPLHLTRRMGLRVLQFLGGSHSALADLLLAEDANADVIGLLLERIRATDHDYADLFGLPYGALLARSAETRELRLIERVEAPVLDLSSGFDAAYAAKTSSKRRNLHRRRLRQLGELGAVSFTYARSAAELATALEAAFELHRARWSGRPDGSGFATARGMAFHREAIAALAAADIPRIVTLQLDGRPIAFHYYFAFCGRMYVHRLAFDPAHARLSPGLLTTLEAIRQAAEEGLQRVEYLGGDERYKLELSDHVEPLCQGVGFTRTLPGRVAVESRLAAIATRKRLKRIEGLRHVYFETLAPTRRALSRLRSAGRRGPDVPA